MLPLVCFESFASVIRSRSCDYAPSIRNLRADRRDATGDMPDWNTLDLNPGKSFDLGKAGIPILKLENITGNRYELASVCPMPGFSITGGASDCMPDRPHHCMAGILPPL